MCGNKSVVKSLVREKERERDGISNSRSLYPYDLDGNALDRRGFHKRVQDPPVCREFSNSFQDSDRRFIGAHYGGMVGLASYSLGHKVH